MLHWIALFMTGLERLFLYFYPPPPHFYAVLPGNQAQGGLPLASSLPHNRVGEEPSLVPYLPYQCVWFSEHVTLQLHWPPLVTWAGLLSFV